MHSLYTDHVRLLDRAARCGCGKSSRRRPSVHAGGRLRCGFVGGRPGMPEVTRAPVHIGMRAMRPRHAAYMRVAAFDPAANPSKNVARPIARPLARRSRSADPHKPRKAGGPRAVSATAPSPPPPRARAPPQCGPPCPHSCSTAGSRRKPKRTRPERLVRVRKVARRTS